MVLLEALPPLAALVYVWLVWTGRFWWWFDHPRTWTLLCWPLPIVVVAATPLIVLSDRVLGVLDVTPPTGVTAGVWVTVAAGFSLRPPRWAFPRWVRHRLSALPPPTSGDGRPDATGAPRSLPALRVARPLPFGELGPRWTWQVDAQAGHLRVDRGELRFVPVTAPSAGDPGALTYSVEPAEAPADGAVERWPLADGHEVRAYPSGAARAASARWAAPAGQVRVERHRARLSRAGRHRGLVAVVVRAPDQPDLHVLVTHPAQLGNLLAAAVRDV